jgi:hypothetical protein
MNSTNLNPSILILTPIKDGVRFLPTYFQNLLQLDYPHDRISLGFLESDSWDNSFKYLDSHLPALRSRFRRVSLYKRDYHFYPNMPRWENSIQIQRRSILAKSRNFLLSKALRDEEWVIWLDVDICSYPIDIIQKLLATGKEILIPECVREHTDRSYDLNTFKLESSEPDLDGMHHTIDGVKLPPKGLGRLYLENLRSFDLVEVDSVGATMLLVKADLHREGLIFPACSYKGYLESEGLAMMAKDLGINPWALPNLKIVHFDC